MMKLINRIGLALILFSILFTLQQLIYSQNHKLVADGVVQFMFAMIIGCTGFLLFIGDNE